MARQENQKKRPLTRARILRTAVRHADKHGIEALNMRRLASLMGTGAMSLYNHVEDRDDLLGGMVERVAGEIAQPAEGQTWQAAIFEIAVSAHRVFMRHPWVNALWSHSGPGPAKLAHLESIVRVLREAGFSVALACRAYHAVTMHITGFTLQALDFPVDSKGMKSAATRFLDRVDADRIPYFVEHVRHHLEHPEPTDEFAFVLDMILDGLSQNLAAEKKGT